MKINGLEKLTLLDYPGHVACTVFLAGCNFRCPYCYNGSLISKDAPVLMEDDQLISVLKKHKRMIDGVCFSGGEPLLRADLPEVAKKIKDEGFLIKLDTNGTSPNRLQAMINNGLVDYVAMDVKNSLEKYVYTTGVHQVDLGAVCDSVQCLLAEECDYEFRTTVVSGLHDENSFHGIGHLVQGAKRYFLQPFSDRCGVIRPGLKTPSQENIETWREIMRSYVREVMIRGGHYDG